ncbi:MAG: Type secretion system protein GspD [Candidatus Hydrogenedentes bacterium]|nr:Type secretion system protein GspD [Candidatus Hydrogenedentota bacterium]
MDRKRWARALTFWAGLLCMALVAWPQDQEVVEEPAEAVTEEAVPAEPAAVPVEEVLPEEEVAAPAEEEAAPEDTTELRPTMPTPIGTRPAPIRPVPVRPSAVRPGRGAEPPAGSPPGATIEHTSELPKEGQTANEAITFDFNNVQLSNVIEAIARFTGKNFDIDPNIGTIPVTVITHDKIPPDMAYQVLESILKSRGFSLMETLDGHLIKVVKTGDQMEYTPFAVGAEATPDRYDTLLTHVVPIKYANVQDLTTIVAVLGSSICKADSYRNSLIVTDTAEGLKRIFKFIEDVDVPGFETKMEIFTLEYTRAEILSEQLQEVLTGEEMGGPGSANRPAPTPVPTRTPTRPSRPTVPGTSTPMVIGAQEEVLRIVPDERLNALIVVATEGMMERVRDLVLRLDTPTPYDANNMHVYELLNANAEDVEAALNTLVGTTPREAGQAGGGPAAGGEIQPFEKKVTITQYEQTNALLILASPQDYKLLKEIIAQLDVPTRQVHLEAIILEVSITDQFTLNVETAGFQNDTHGVTALNNVVKLANILTQGPLAVAGAGLTTAYMDGTTTITVPTGEEGTLTPMTIPNIPLLITALENMTDIDVLSQPSLTTRDNEVANIVVGQELPVPNMRSGYSYNPQNPDRQNQNYGYGMSSMGNGISREDVGVKMEVTPHINEGDYVSAEITIEVSQPIVSDVGIDPNELGPTFQKSQIKNNVVIKDGSTGVIGGLISEATDHSRRQTPILGDVPVLGRLFRSRGDNRRKRNLVVLLTPHIVKEGVELERLTQYRMDEFRESNVDVLFEKGFIEKIKKRNHMRNQYRPSIERSKTFDSDTAFGRGDIPR